MAKSISVTHIQDLNIPLPFELYTILYITNLILHLHIFHFTFSIPITPSDTENYLPSDDPNITNLMVSHYNCAKQHNLRPFNLLNVKHLHLFNFTFSIPITPSDTDNYLPSDDPKITNLMVSHYDCAKQHNLTQFNLLNVN